MLSKINKHNYLLIKKTVPCIYVEVIISLNIIIACGQDV